MIRPVPLKKGDKIALIAPAGFVLKEKVDKSIKFMDSLGFEVVVGVSCYSKHGYFAGTDEVRVNDINKMFLDKDIKGVFAIRGGYGGARLLDKIDFDIIRNNPKVFVGYSDITILHIAINQRCNLITYHGPMPSTELCEEVDQFTMSWYEKNIFKEDALGVVSSLEEHSLKVLVQGEAIGQLVGGNLSLIVSSIGTEYEIDTKGKILFIEDIDESPYKIDRMLLQLHQAGKLRDCAGIVLGAFTNCVPADLSRSLSLDDVINEIIIPNNKPTISNVKCGHCLPTLTLPLGTMAKIDTKTGTFEILE